LTNHVSILQDEVQHRKALKFHSYGLLPLLEQACFFDRNQWRVTRKDGTIADLSLIFRDVSLITRCRSGETLTALYLSSKRETTTATTLHAPDSATNCPLNTCGRQRR